MVTKQYKSIELLESIRRKVQFGEDPDIFTRSRELRPKEMEIFRKLPPLEQRNLGRYMHETKLIPDRIIPYSSEGYNGNYTGYGFPFEKIGPNYIFSHLNFSNFPEEVEQTQDNLGGLAKIIREDLIELFGKSFIESLFFKRKKIQIEVMSFFKIPIITLSPKTEKFSKSNKYLLYAYAANLQQGKATL